jgi:hypothetical protein
VGQRNYLFFFGFTTSVCCLAVTVIPFLLWYLLVSLVGTEDDTSEEGNADDDGIFTGILITIAVAGGLLALMVMGLWAYHVFLICSGLTTKEHLRGRRVKNTLPGYGDELTIFARRGPRLFNLRALVEATRQTKPGSREEWQIKVESKLEEV